MTLDSLKRNVTVFTLWTFLYFGILRWFLIANWNFDIVAGWHWRYITYQWWYGGWVIAGAYYWIFVFTLLLAVPLWIIGFCFVAQVPYKKLYEKYLQPFVLRYKSARAHEPVETANGIQVKRRQSYKDVRPKPLNASVYAVQPKSTPGDAQATQFKQTAPAPAPASNYMSGDDFTFKDTKVTPVAQQAIPDMFAEEEPAKEALVEDLEKIMTDANCKFLKDIRIGDDKLDYLAISEETLYFCLKDNEKGDWLADEERFNNEDPLWFSESSHRISPLTVLAKMQEKVLTTLMGAGMPFIGKSILVKAEGNIINAEDMIETWDKMEVKVCRTNLGSPDELPSFAETFPANNKLISDETFDKIKTLLA